MQATKNPKKQRKKMFNAPAHIRHKLMGAPLSPELLAQRGVKTLPVRKGDTVRILRGDRKGFEGKVSRIDLKHYRVFIEGLTREKVDGTTIFVAVHPSKVMIKTLNLDDKVRKAILERKKPIIKKGAKPAKKAAKKPVEEKPAAAEEAPAEPKAEAPVEPVAEETSKEGGT
jgi:large subunit ribosomal protein L24